jgi:hypothetical protein
VFARPVTTTGSLSLETVAAGTLEGWAWGLPGRLDAAHTPPKFRGRSA